jgi:hypothetical protein
MKLASFETKKKLECITEKIKSLTRKDKAPQSKKPLNNYHQQQRTLGLVGGRPECNKGVGTMKNWHGVAVVTGFQRLS